MRVAGHLGQETAHFQLGVQPRSQPAIALQEQPFVQRDDRVAAHGAGPAHRQVGQVVACHAGKHGGRTEQQAPLRRWQLDASADSPDHRAAKGLVVKSIAHDADIGLLTHLGQGR